ncbi:MAG: adenosylcobalamin-dependent ribonucleoside-diphosphate reductase [Steroidobacteraceae bacterium]
MTETGKFGLSRFIWESRYRDPDAEPPEERIEDSWNRVATAVAAVERDADAWREKFLAILRDYRFLPGGRILAGAGVAREVTLFSCFVMGVIEDSVEGIFEALKEGAQTMQQGGGVGYDFSTLRPRGSPARRTGMIASGPVSFMRIWDAMCATILSTGARRGAMMATLRCDLPDIEEFIDAKRQPDALTRFNLSVLITDDFMGAVQADAAWPLVFPDHSLAEGDTREHIERFWTGAREPTKCRIVRRVRARELWARICASAFDCAEPGLLFIDRINAANNLAYCESLSATNPCAEEPLPPYGACDLGSLNLTQFVVDPFLPSAHIDYASLRETARVAVRLLDNVIDVSRFPLPRQRAQVFRSRRIGLGVTGLADCLAMLRLRYDTPAARAEAEHIVRDLRDAAYRASIELAGEKGAFPALEVDNHLDRPFVRALPEELRAGIRRHGIRNSHLLALAPGGTISLLANGVSSGIEPIFALEGTRRVLDNQGQWRPFQSIDYAFALWRRNAPPHAGHLPEYFVTSDAIAPRDHLLMQAALQAGIDGAISKTIALGESVTRAEVPGILLAAFELGLKGCTLYRAQARPGVLSRCGMTLAEHREAEPPCASLDEAGETAPAT